VASKVWSGTTSNLWSVGGAGGNWSNAAAPTTGDDVVFNATSTLNRATVQDIGNLSITKITMTGDPGAAISINNSTGTLTLSATGTLCRYQNLSITGTSDVILGAAQTWTATLTTLSVSNRITGTNRNFTLTGTGNINISGVIATGSGTLTKAGTGSATLSGANTYTGTTTITRGILSVSSIVVSGGASNLGNATSAIIFGSTTLAGTLSYTGADATFTRGFTVNLGTSGIKNTTANTLTIGTGDIACTDETGVTLETTGSGNIVVNSDITGALSLVTTKNSSTGKIILNGTNTAPFLIATTGEVRLNGVLDDSDGEIIVLAGAALSGTGTSYSTVTIGAGGIFAPGDGTNGGTFTVEANLVIDDGGIIVFLLGTLASKIVATEGILDFSGAVVRVSSGSGFTAKNYTLITHSTAVPGAGSLGVMPRGYSGAIVYSTNLIELSAKRGTVDFFKMW
jgi:fibronectin-binding autotransporter adhesin